MKTDLPTAHPRPEAAAAPLRVACFSATRWLRDSFRSTDDLSCDYFEVPLDADTARLAAGYRVVTAFVNDRLDAATLRVLDEGGTRLVALRCAGYNNVDLAAAASLGIAVVRVPAYSPYAVAEHAAGLILTLNRRFHRAWNRVRDGNFSLDGLVGFDIHGKTVGVVGTGRIGLVFAGIMKGFGARVIAFDRYPNADAAARGLVEYVELETLWRESDIISLHCPLTPESHHLVNADSLALMKPGVMIINTSRGPLIDSDAAIEALKSGRIGQLGLDVYEEEEDLFFRDLSDVPIQDDVFVRLESFPNVLITAHQAFFTREALANIADTTRDNIRAWRDGLPLANQVKA